MDDTLLAPLGMDHSTFVRSEVHAADDRAVGHEASSMSPSWTSRWRLPGASGPAPRTSPASSASSWTAARSTAAPCSTPRSSARCAPSPRLMRKLLPATRSGWGVPAGGRDGASTCSPTGAAATASCRTCGSSPRSSSASPCSRTPPSTTCRERWRSTSSVTWSTTRTVASTIACCGSLPRTALSSQMGSSCRLPTWASGSALPRCRAPAASPGGGASAPGSTAPVSWARRRPSRPPGST